MTLTIACLLFYGIVGLLVTAGIALAEWVDDHR